VEHGNNGILIVIPTGGGKTIVIAEIIKRMLEYENTRILVISSQKEILKQNYIAITDYINNQLLDIGIYSAGLNCRNTRNRILITGIQSVRNRAWEIGFFDLCIIDEVHNVPSENEGTYRKFINDLFKINQNLILCGLSATIWRTKGGLLCDEGHKNRIFQDICYEVTIKELINPEHYKNKDKKQYLCDLISKNGINKVDLTGVHVRGGEYVPGEMEKAFQKNDLVCKAVNEIATYTRNRKKILVFCAGIKHCEEVTEKLNKIGQESKFVHSKQSKNINDKNLQDFKDGKFKFLCNVGILTTGFDDKEIDAIILLRSTMSPGLYYQMCGRGLRLSPSKENCLILDFGTNIERMGPIDKIEIRKKKDGTREITTAPMKPCPNCGQLLFLAATECPTCGFVFDTKDKHKELASEADILSKWEKPKEYTIDHIFYGRHQKAGKPDSFKIDYYYDDFNKWSTYVCIEHGGFAKQKAMQFLKKITDKKITTVTDALSECQNFRKPIKIVVDLNDKFPKIIKYQFDDTVDIPFHISREKQEQQEINQKQEKISSEDFDEQLMRLM